MTYPWNAGEVLTAADLNSEFASKVDYATPTNAQSGTGASAYTFVLADAQRLTTATGTSAKTFTIPPQSSVTWLPNSIIRVANYGAGDLTIAGGSGVTVTNAARKLAQHESASIIRTGSNAWTVIGDGLPSTGGKILQIVRATDSTLRTTTSTTPVDVTGMSVTITPQKSDSAVLIIASGNLSSSWTTGVLQYLQLLLTDSSNNAVPGAQGAFYGIANMTGSSTQAWYSAFTLIGYATPATTSAVTYKLRFKTDSANTTASIRNNESTGTMYAIEVSA